MEILFLCHRIPYPPNKGDKIRAFHILEHLVKSHRVHLGCFIDDPNDYAHVPELKRLVTGDCFFAPLTKASAIPGILGALLRGSPLTTAFFASGKMDRWAEDTLQTHSIDRAFLFSSAMAPFLLRQRNFDFGKVILDMVDVDSDKWSQYASESSGTYKFVYRREARTLLKLERESAAKFGATLLVSPYEVASFLSLAPETAGRVHSVGNGVDLDHFSPTESFARPFPDNETSIVMTGAMNYRPNAEGAIWFAKAVLPKILKTLPNVRLYVVGSNPTKELAQAANANCVVTGTVADVRPYIAHAAAIVAPLHIARGVQNKVLEAMAMQKPVVATSAATRALQVRPGIDLHVADDPDAFAVAVIAASTGTNRDTIALNGRRYVESHHRWADQLRALDHLIQSPTNFALEETKRVFSTKEIGTPVLSMAVADGTKVNQ